MASNLTKRKQDEPEPGHKLDEDLCWSGYQCVPSPPLSLSSHSIYLSSADIDAVLTIAMNYPWRCTPCLVSHRSSLATPLREAPPSPSARANPHPLARCAPMSSTQSTTSHTKRAASTPPRTSQAESTIGVWRSHGSHAVRLCYPRLQLHAPHPSPLSPSTSTAPPSPPPPPSIPTSRLHTTYPRYQFVPRSQKFRENFPWHGADP